MCDQSVLEIMIPFIGVNNISVVQIMMPFTGHLALIMLPVNGTNKQIGS
jgi:hypothetical protein